MRRTTSAFAFALIASASAQNVSSVYNRDTHEQFKLKGIKVDQTVVGPIVRTSTLLTFENPYKNLTEASVNFDLPEDGALGGFGYYYGDEYVRGQLMDKAKAWFIYTAITSRNRDPGIMDQVTPTSYHCQIFPLKVGHDLRVRLWTVGMLKPSGDKLTLPKPQVNYVAEGLEPSEWNVRAVRAKPVRKEGDTHVVDMSAPISAIAQRHRDGRTYVAGLLRAQPTLAGHKIVVKRAWYGPSGAHIQGADVTAKVAELVRQGDSSVHAINQNFGDPNPGVVKELFVDYSLDGTTVTKIVTESQTMNLLADLEQVGLPKLKGLRQTKVVTLDPQTVAFYGWVPSNRTISGTFAGRAMKFKPKTVGRGSDTARLWAQQRLAQDTWTNRRDVLKFSLRYGVPSAFTALLAVPQEEMKLFRAKEKEFNKQEALRRKQELAAERNRRRFNNGTNWNRSGGGDPEIRVTYPDAKKVFAVLPDGRVLTLTAMGNGIWGGNFDIPATAAEGKYHVRIVAVNGDGKREEQTLDYDVDRTAPVGKATFRVEDGKLILEVVAEADLNEVAAYRLDGSRILLTQREPGLYRAELPLAPVALKIVLKDAASNKQEIPCSWSR